MSFGQEPVGKLDVVGVIDVSRYSTVDGLRILADPMLAHMRDDNLAVALIGTFDIAAFDENGSILVETDKSARARLLLI